MAATVIDGKRIADLVKSDVAARAAGLRAAGHAPRLDAILVSDDTDTAAHVYAANQQRNCEALGIDYRLHELGAESTVEQVAALVRTLNLMREVNGIMAHMPMPPGIDAYRIQRLIDPEKDVEGVNPAIIGNIVYGRSSLAPCTALAIMKLIESTGIELRGRRAVVVGASNIVGKPVAVMLMRPEATVISCNRFTQDVPGIARTADVLIAAAGVVGLVRRDWVKPGAVVIDVGIHRVPINPPLPDGTKMRTTGDVAFDEVAEVAGWISPVPGGVGPVTVAMLMSNVIAAAEAQKR